jgi:hypothetical protein
VVEDELPEWKVLSPENVKSVTLLSENKGNDERLWWQINAFPAATDLVIRITLHGEFFT